MKKLLFGLSILILTSCGNQNSNSIASKFEWDFSEQKKFSYSLSQIINVENKNNKTLPFEKSYVTVIGNLNVIVKEGQLADLSLTDTEMNVIDYDKLGMPKDTLTQKAPPTVVQDMKPNGDFSDPSVDVFFKMLLPLPKKALKNGASEEIPMKTPFNVNGFSLFSEGQNTLTFKGFENIGERNCAVLEGEIDISKLEIPEDLKGEYKSTMIGNATYYFDLENRCYVGSDIETTMEMIIGYEIEGKNNFQRYSEMKHHNTIKIRLEKIEE